jgi:hypothetical protein
VTSLESRLLPCIRGHKLFVGAIRPISVVDIVGKIQCAFKKQGHLGIAHNSRWSEDRGLASCLSVAKVKGVFQRKRCWQRRRDARITVDRALAVFLVGIVCWSGHLDGEEDGLKKLVVA